MNIELMEKIAKTRLMKEYGKRPAETGDYLISRGANYDNMLDSFLLNETTKHLRGNLDTQKESGKITKDIMRLAVNDTSRHGKTLDDIKKQAKAKLLKNKLKNAMGGDNYGEKLDKTIEKINDSLKMSQEYQDLLESTRESIRNDRKLSSRLSGVGNWIKNNPGKTTAIAAAPIAIAGTAAIANAAYQNRKALRQREEADKTASLDYDEMVKFAYEDILGGFEKSAAENDDEEKARKERKEKMLKRLAAAGALTAGATAAGVGLYKYQHRPGRYYSETSAFRKNMRDAMRGKPVEDWNDKVEIVTPGNSHHTILTPLLSAAH
jgi:hypothetical protein